MHWIGHCFYGRDFSSMGRSFFLSGHFGEHYVWNVMAEIFSSEGGSFFFISGHLKYCSWKFWQFAIVYVRNISCRGSVEDVGIQYLVHHVIYVICNLVLLT